MSTVEAAAGPAQADSSLDDAMAGELHGELLRQVQLDLQQEAEAAQQQEQAAAAAVAAAAGAFGGGASGGGAGGGAGGAPAAAEDGSGLTAADYRLMLEQLQQDLEQCQQVAGGSAAYMGADGSGTSSTSAAAAASAAAQEQAQAEEDERCELRLDELGREAAALNSRVSIGEVGGPGRRQAAAQLWRRMAVLGWHQLQKPGGLFQHLCLPLPCCCSHLSSILLSCLQWKAKEAKRQRDMGMLCCYWEGLVAAHLRAGKTDWWAGGRLGGCW